MTHYEINFGFGIAQMYTSADDPESRFYCLANQCFGIRKSISQCVIKDKGESEIPEPWNKFEGAHEVLTHSDDVIVWNVEGDKIKSEWD